jgi:broad specificity phosphatase PhoE
MVIWLVRHGAAAWPPGAALGWSEPPLSEEGVEEARAVAARLSARPVDAVYSSDLERARATAVIVAAAHDLEVVASADLRELDFGAWEGRELAALWREHPDQARAWEADIRDAPPGFGESVAELETRVARFADRLRAAADGEAAVVAHRGSLAALEAALLGSPFSDAFRDGLTTGALRRIEVEC